MEPRINEPRKRYRFGQRPTAIATQVDDHTADVLFFQFSASFLTSYETHIEAPNAGTADFLFYDSLHQHFNHAGLRDEYVHGSMYRPSGSYPAGKNLQTNFTALRPFD